MKTVAHELTHENIENVAAYLQAMPNEMAPR
jgi:cytochrome c553